MCILFLYVDPDPKPGDYRLIVATNRDEYYKRPALDASWIDEGLLGGRDMEPGREGGMWFGFSSKENGNGGGKKYCVATLLNLTGDKVENADGRGVIVKDYLKTPLDFPQYAKKLDERNFSGYNLIAVELCKDDARIFQHSNRPKISSVYSGKQTLGFGNSPVFSQLSKVRDGRIRFEEIVSSGLRGDGLVKELVALLKDETSHLPDVELEKRSPIGYSFLSSIFVKIAQQGYGTRAHSVVLIDYDWNLRFVEYAMKQPIDIDSPEWNVSQIQSRL